MNLTELCPMAEIDDNHAKGMVAVVEGKQRNILVARKGEQAFAYLNWCPHNQVLIDQIPGKFFDAEHQYLQCSKHGAKFRVEDGRCIEGPCEGGGLKQLSLELKDGVVFLAES